MWNPVSSKFLQRWQKHMWAINSIVWCFKEVLPCQYAVGKDVIPALQTDVTRIMSSENYVNNYYTIFA
jgi:hypothetical protein